MNSTIMLNVICHQNVCVCMNKESVQKFKISQAPTVSNSQPKSAQLEQRVTEPLPRMRTRPISEP